MDRETMSGDEKNVLHDIASEMIDYDLLLELQEIYTTPYEDDYLYNCCLWCYKNATSNKKDLYSFHDLYPHISVILSKLLLLE